MLFYRNCRSVRAILKLDFLRAKNVTCVAIARRWCASNFSFAAKFCAVVAWSPEPHNNVVQTCLVFFDYPCCLPQVDCCACEAPIYLRMEQSREGTWGSHCKYHTHFRSLYNHNIYDIYFTYSHLCIWYWPVLWSWGTHSHQKKIFKQSDDQRHRFSLFFVFDIHVWD